MLSRITQLVAGFVYTAVTGGISRTLVEGGEVFNGDSITVTAPSCQWGRTVCVMQDRTLSAWTDSISILMSVASGCGHTLTFRVSVSGTESDSEIRYFFTGGGDQHITSIYNEQLRRQVQRGTPYTVAGVAHIGTLDAPKLSFTGQMAGSEQNVSLSVVSDRVQFASALPKVGDGITISGVQYVISTIENDDAIVTFGLANP